MLVDPQTVELMRAVGTPLAVLGSGVTWSITWFRLAIRRMGREQADAILLDNWRSEHQKEADKRDAQLESLQALINEVKSTNTGQDIRIKMLEEEMRDNRKASQGRLS